MNHLNPNCPEALKLLRTATNAHVNLLNGHAEGVDTTRIAAGFCLHDVRFDSWPDRVPED